MFIRGVRPATLLPLLTALALPLGAGCAIPTRVAELNLEIPRQATPVALDAGLRALDDPETKRRMEHMLASPEMKSIQRELLAGMVDGSLAALSEKDRADRIGALASQYTVGVLHGISREIAPELAPAASEAMRSAMKGAMGEALSTENQREVQRFVGSLAQASMQPLTKSLSEANLAGSAADALVKDFGPAFQKVLRDNMGPGLAEVLKDESVRRELGATAHILGREMVLGANEAFVQIQSSKPQGESSLAGRISTLASKGAKLADTMTWVFIAIVVVLGAWIIKLLMQARRYRQESEQRAAATRLLNEARKASEGKPWSAELLGALEGQLLAEEEELLRRRDMRRRHLRRQPHGA